MAHVCATNWIESYPAADALAHMASFRSDIPSPSTPNCASASACSKTGAADEPFLTSTSTGASSSHGSGAGRSAGCSLLLQFLAQQDILDVAEQL